MSLMRLLKYRVTKYKSIMDSGWIECDDVTTFVGVNEAGKSNLLLALWKLNPAKGGEIKFSDDMPIKLFSDLRDASSKPIFIEAEFLILDQTVLDSIVKLSSYSKESISIVRVGKDYDGKIYISFPNATLCKELKSDNILNILNVFNSQISTLEEAGKTEEGIKEECFKKYSDSLSIISSKTVLTKSEINSICDCFQTITAKEMQSSKIRPVIVDTYNKLTEIRKVFQLPEPSSIKEVNDIIIQNMPKFVYYSNYGNLDSEIYLPHVIENLNRTDLSGITEAKTRTLKVLFEYVNLDPNEILEMGKDAQGPTDSYGRPGKPSESEIKEKAEKKTERNILLQSASTKLTRDFRNWWNQGNYNFDFQADGKHFRIWVSDNIRPERVALENRSTGLQWFLSFYLIFLVESQDEHSDAILLLDEAGLSLHPLAQKDLSIFFNNLSKTNQILNTTHSPFIIDTSNIDRVKLVYVDKEGYTVVSSNLRAAEERLQTNSVYAVHAALGLTISDILLQGCKLVVVEGTSDQYYLNAIKLFLISKNIVSPKTEIVFAPSGGAKPIRNLASLLSAKSELPVVFIDSDKTGTDFKDKLLKSLYSHEVQKVMSVKDFTTLENAEIEDLIPFELLERPIDRLFNNVDLDFASVYDSSKPIIGQIESFSKEHGISLDKGYKVFLAKQVKNALLIDNLKFDNKDCIEIWKQIFDKIISL